MTLNDVPVSTPSPDAEADAEALAVAEAALRLDKWLWFARFCKSRSLATRLCQSGRMRVNGTVTSKAHYPVRPGMVLTFPLGKDIRVIRIEALGHRRGPTSEAQTLYTDLRPPAQAQRTQAPAPCLTQ